MSRTEELTARLCHKVDPQLEPVDETINSRWKPTAHARQPTHTVYVPANLASSSIPSEWGRQGLAEIGMPLAELARKLGMKQEVVEEVAQRAEAKCSLQPIEDLRIDFEDGFTQRAVIHEADSRDLPRAIAADEDERAHQAAATLADFFTGRSHCPPSFAGVRIKSFSPESRHRGLRTLAIVLQDLAANGALGAITPHQFRITLPKVQHHLQVASFVDALSLLERELRLPFPLGFEVQVETPQAIVGEGGVFEATRILDAAGDRCLSFHYGTYDYSAYLGVDAPEQSLTHPVANFAKGTLQVVAATMGVEVSDGSTNWIARGTGTELLAGLKNHYDLVTYHLRRGIRQGWDLAPIQLPTRHLATIHYFRKDYVVAAQRLRDYLDGNTSRWMDEPATAKAMAGFLVRALDCQAIDRADLDEFGLGDPATLQSLHKTGKLTS